MNRMMATIIDRTLPGGNGSAFNTYLNIVDDIHHRTEGEAGQSTSRLVQNE